jgi:phosphoadenosine phosphosulfate reductase
MIENTLFESVDRVVTPSRDIPLEQKALIAIERLRLHEPPGGYYFATSCGKDSVLVQRLLDLSGVKYEAHYHNTTVDPPEHILWLRKAYPTVVIDRPETTMWELIAYKRQPPRHDMRYCCEALKERHGSNRTVVDGVRWQESTARSKRPSYERCTKRADTMLLHPIIEWSTKEVWYYIRTNGLPYSPLYDEGWKRVGCVMCPLAPVWQMLKQAERWPKIADAYKRACRRAFERGPVPGNEDKWDWLSGDDMYHRWIINAGRRDNTQCMLFE